MFYERVGLGRPPHGALRTRELSAPSPRPLRAFRRLVRAMGEALGFVEGLETEWGYFSVSEMGELNLMKGFNVIERDEHFIPAPMSRARR